MRRAILVAMAGLIPLPAMAQSSNLQDQINNVFQAQQQNQDAAIAAQQAQQRAWQEQQARADRAARRAWEARAAQQRAQQARADAERQRDESYQDQLRAMDIQQKELDLQQQKARVARENDFIDQDLNREKAETDAIQSQADAARNLSSGAESYLNKEGDADIKSAGSGN